MKTSTRKIDNIKSFENEIKLIEKFNSYNEHDVKIDEKKDVISKFSRKENKFNFEINARVIDYFENTCFSFEIDDKIYQVKKTGSTSNNSEFRVDASASFSTTLEVNSFHSQHFKQNDLFKAFFPVDLREIKTFHSEFETVTCQVDGNEYFYDCIRISINEVDYDVTQVKTDLIGFYVFECLNKQSFKEFSDACFSIKQAIGFISKLMVGGEKFVFDSSKNLYYSNYIRPTIKGMYSPIVTNPYSYPDIDKEVADKYFKSLTRITLENLSNLTSKIHNDSEFSTAIILILESTSIRSLLLIPSSFAVIIEMLSKKLSREEFGLEKPIKDNKLEKKIIKEFHDIIERNNRLLSDNSALKLKRRLNEINKPINKQHLTNNEKLTRPFEQLGISLSFHETSIIEHRNDLLHGNVLLKSDDNQSDESINLYMAYVSAKLFTLISKLILKSIGYKGYVYNQSKYLEKHMEIKTEEQFFQEI